MEETQQQVQQICEIPFERAKAADNMAIDATLLALGCRLGQAFWRIYGWSEPAITFGYSQYWSWIRTTMGDFEGACVRRMTGGGIVDHRRDLTYCLTVPPVHAFFRQPATEMYRGIHQLITTILLDLGFPAAQQPCLDKRERNAAASICFDAAEPHDVILQPSGKKVAGAAMKRNRQGILIQGSLNLKLLPGLQRQDFMDSMGISLAHWLKVKRTRFSGVLPPEILLAERERFKSREWNRKR